MYRIRIIIWYYGEFKAGIYNDLKIAIKSFTLWLLPGENAIADKRYLDKRYFFTPYTLFYNSLMLKIIMTRHEVVNQRIRSFQCMRQIFRNGLEKQKTCFLSVIQLVHMKLQNGKPLALLCTSWYLYI